MLLRSVERVCVEGLSGCDVLSLTVCEDMYPRPVPEPVSVASARNYERVCLLVQPGRPEAVELRN